MQLVGRSQVDQHRVGVVELYIGLDHFQQVAGEGFQVRISLSESIGEKECPECHLHENGHFLKLPVSLVFCVSGPLSQDQLLQSGVSELAVEAQTPEDVLPAFIPLLLSHSGCPLIERKEFGDCFFSVPLHEQPENLHLLQIDQGARYNLASFEELDHP